MKALTNFVWNLEEDFIKNAMSKENVCYNTCTWGYSDDSFYFTIYPNGKDDNQKGQFWIEYNLLLRYNSKVEVDLICFVSSERGIKRRVNTVFETSGKRSIMFAEHELLLNPSYHFFYNGKFTLNFEMKINFDEKSEVFLHRTSFLSQKLVEDQNVDCWMVGDDGVKLEAHCLILKMFSPIFKAMIEAQDDDDDINIEVSGFEYEVIKNAIDFCYGHLFMDILDLDGLLSLYKFADKYKMDDLKKELYYEMLPKILPENVCKVTNNIAECDDDTHFMKKRCVDRIRRYYAERKKIHNIYTLNDEIKKEIFDKLMITECKIDYISSFKSFLMTGDSKLLFCFILILLIAFFMHLLSLNAQK